jgi:hypothetical protein
MVSIHVLPDGLGGMDPPQELGQKLGHLQLRLG